MFPLLLEILTMIFLILFAPPIQEQFHVLLIVGVTVRGPEYDVNDGVSLTLP